MSKISHFKREKKRNLSQTVVIIQIFNEIRNTHSIQQTKLCISFFEDKRIDWSFCTIFNISSILSPCIGRTRDENKNKPNKSDRKECGSKSIITANMQTFTQHMRLVCIDDIEKRKCVCNFYCLQTERIHHTQSTHTQAINTPKITKQNKNRTCFVRNKLYRNNWLFLP